MRFDVDGIFEIKRYCLAARIGKIRTKSGFLETPYLFPVIDTRRQFVSTQELNELGFKGLITNSYLLFKRKEIVDDIHVYLNHDGVVMTDSGGYQILEFGQVNASQEEIIGFQEKINVDIAVILDVPTGSNANYAKAFESVQSTLNNAQTSIKLRTREDILWVGPIQGGEYLDLVKVCTQRLSSLPFHILALGSPTEFLERYNYEKVLQMIYTVKLNAPPSRPIHLFGAGHPAILPFFVALGVDLFDSASYALYARDDRYLTSLRTYRLDDIYEFPCKCDVCRKFSPKELRSLNKDNRRRLLAKHNIFVLAQEMAIIKQAIYHGTLWDLIQSKAHYHPALFRAFKFLINHKRYLSKYAYLNGMGRSGLFVLDHERPELLSIKKRIKEHMLQNHSIKKIAIINGQKISSIHELYKKINQIVNEFKTILIFNPLFGLIPFELSEIYPLYQLDVENSVSLKRAALNSINFLKRINVEEIYVDDELLLNLFRKTFHAKVQLLTKHNNSN